MNLTFCFSLSHSTLNGRNCPTCDATTPSVLTDCSECAMSAQLISDISGYGWIRPQIWLKGARHDLNISTVSTSSTSSLPAPRRLRGIWPYHKERGFFPAVANVFCTCLLLAPSVLLFHLLHTPHCSTPRFSSYILSLILQLLAEHCRH